MNERDNGIGSLARWFLIGTGFALGCISSLGQNINITFVFHNQDATSLSCSVYYNSFGQPCGGVTAVGSAAPGGTATAGPYVFSYGTPLTAGSGLNSACAGGRTYQTATAPSAGSSWTWDIYSLSAPPPLAMAIACPCWTNTSSQGALVGMYSSSSNGVAFAQDQMTDQFTVRYVAPFQTLCFCVTNFNTAPDGSPWCGGAGGWVVGDLRPLQPNQPPRGVDVSGTFNCTNVVGGSTNAPIQVPAYQDDDG